MSSGDVKTQEDTSHPTDGGERTGKRNVGRVESVETQGRPCKEGGSLGGSVSSKWEVPGVLFNRDLFISP